MTAFNVVRFRVKPGRDQEFIDAHKTAIRGFPGMRGFSLIKTGESTYCIIGEWASFEKIVKARPGMIAVLNSFRDCLEDFGGGLGVTDPIAGTVVLELRSKPKRKAKRAKAVEKKGQSEKRARKPVKKKPAKRGRRR